MNACPYNRNMKRIPKNIYKETNFALCVPLIKLEDEYHILFEVRSSKIRQANEICFPGGKVEENETLLEACIRETKEELLIDDIEIIEQLDYYQGFNQSNVYPFLGLLNNIPSKYNTDEVKEIFTVPVSYFINHETELISQNVEIIMDERFPYDKIKEFLPYKFVKGEVDFVFYEYDQHVIWGLTARLLYHNLKYIQEYIKK